MKKLTINSKKNGIIDVILDDKDYDFLLDKHVYIHRIGNYLYAKINPGKLPVHRFLMGSPKGKCIDHINRNTLDNRRTNLRIVTIRQNLQNQLRSSSKTGHSGVTTYSYDKSKFIAYIKDNYKLLHLGVFNTLKEAISARKKAEKDLGWINK